MPSEHRTAKEEDWNEAGEFVGGVDPDADVEADTGREEDDVEAKTFRGFSDKLKLEFEGMAHLGDLEHQVEFAGHSFDLRTPTVGEKLQVGLICKQFEGTLAYARAMKAAIVAAALVKVDGRLIPVAEKRRSVVKQKFEYIVNVWYDPTINFLYDRVEEMEQVVAALVEELGIESVTRNVVDLPDEGVESVTGGSPEAE